MSRDGVDPPGGSTVEPGRSGHHHSGFGRHLRLLKPAEYAAVFSERRVVRGARFALHYRPNGLAFARLGLVIPKKQARTAVLRNAIKRQARELFRQRRHGLPALDIVLRLARPAATTPGNPSTDRQARAGWRAEIAGLLDRLGGARHGGEMS